LAGGTTMRRFGGEVVAADARAATAVRSGEMGEHAEVTVAMDAGRAAVVDVQHIRILPAGTRPLHAPHGHRSP
jgi:hypothetical protein